MAQGLRRPTFPEAPLRYDRSDQSRMRHLFEQFAREVQARITAIEDSLEDLDTRVSDLEP